MVELRWVHRQETIKTGATINDLPVVHVIENNRVLQYRQFEDQGRVINEWSDWQDVPEVEDE